MLSKNLEHVRAIDIANSMRYSKPSVSIALKKLKALATKNIILWCFLFAAKKANIKETIGKR